jgi:hypothetical protein
MKATIRRLETIFLRDHPQPATGSTVRSFAVDGIEMTVAEFDRLPVERQAAILEGLPDSPEFEADVARFEKLPVEEQLAVLQSDRRWREFHEEAVA